MSDLLRPIVDPRRFGSAFPLAALALCLPLYLAACGDDAGDVDDVGEDGVEEPDLRTDAAVDTPRGPNVISISLVADTPHVDMTSACGRRGNRVQWAFPANVPADTAGISEWSVKFTEGSPFRHGDTLIESGPNVTVRRGAVISDTVPVDSAFPYVIQVIRDSVPLGSDPEIVIKDASMVGRPCKESPKPASQPSP